MADAGKIQVPVVLKVGSFQGDMVEQLTIANLIAYRAQLPESSPLRAQLGAEIEERLGLSSVG